jgi:hypothetical protein
LTEIYVDGDACPVREEIYRVAARLRLNVLMSPMAHECHSNGILRLCSGFGSEDPKGGSRDEVALKVEGVVDRTMHVGEALGGSA